MVIDTRPLNIELPFIAAYVRSLYTASAVVTVARVYSKGKRLSRDEVLRQCGAPLELIIFFEESFSIVEGICEGRVTRCILTQDKHFYYDVKESSLCYESECQFDHSTRIWRW